MLDEILRCRFEESKAFLHDATVAVSDDPLSFFRLANSYFALQDFDTASRMYFESLKRCTEDDPLLVKIHINMGISLESQGIMLTAEREYRRAAELAPNHPRVYKLLGSARYALGDLEGASQALNHALTYDFVCIFVAVHPIPVPEIENTIFWINQKLSFIVLYAVLSLTLRMHGPTWDVLGQLKVKTNKPSSA